MKSKYIRLCFFCLLLATLILEPQTGSNAASKGIEQCLKSIIPSVFPFLFLGNAIAGSIAGIRIKSIERLLRIPQGYGSYFFLGQLCGYPVGAMLLQKEADSGNVSARDAARMINFCNNASPAFIIGILSSVFSVRAAIIMWGIQIFSSFVLGIILPNEPKQAIERHHTNANISKVIKDAVSGLVNICAWVILFRILLSYLGRIIILSGLTGAMITGLFELTNGLFCAGEILPQSISYTLCAFLLSFGGICVLLQTTGAAPVVKLNTYIFSRLFHGLLSSTFAYIVAKFLFPQEQSSADCTPLFLCALLVCALIFVFGKNYGRN